MNVLIRGVDSYNRYQSKILEKIWEKIDCNKCVIISRNHDGKDKYSKEKYVDIPVMNCLKKPEISGNELAIPESVLLGMKPFESRIYETMIRDYLLPIYSFEECKERYFNELLYWYKIIVENKIDYMIFHNAPHFTHDYIIYCLGKNMNIPTLLFQPTFFPGRLEWGEEYDLLGYSIKEKKDEILKNKNLISLSDDLQKIYDKYIGGFNRSDFVKTNNSYKSIYKKAKIDIDYIKKDVILCRREEILEDFFMRKSISGKKECINRYVNDVKKTNKCKKYIENNIIIEKYKGFEKLTEKKIKQKYVYYGLQCSPESNLMPKLPAFYEQKHMILTLAKAAEKLGLQLYIKEHWNQPLREKELYQFISKYKNIHLFGPQESNIALLKNSVAIATGSGSCLMEGMFNNIPAITFGDGYWNGAPGIFRVHNEGDCIQVLKRALNNEIQISKMQIIAYLKAIEEETVCMNLYPNMDFGNPFSEEQCINRTSEFIIQWLKKY